MTAATPRRLRELAPAKVNLCLFLGPVRGDQRHQLVTVFESVSLHDELTVSTAGDGADRVLCAGVEGPNLVGDAIARLRARGWAAPALHVEIVKRIPVAGGMGGGSADAGAMLRLAPALAPVSGSELAAVAAELGADVPAQLAPGLTLGTGAGEVVRPLAALADHCLVIVPLAEQLSTAAVYAEADRLALPRGGGELAELLDAMQRELQPGGRIPASLMVNDLEPAARALCPPIAEALDRVRATGADEALVCGSGPTVAGLFWGEHGHARAERAASALRSHFPQAGAVPPVSSNAYGKIGST